MKNKVDKLKEISDILKSEYVGISDIIDKLIQDITPWYVTPEIINRPVVISLWGLTGTGKTSVVRRLTELLEISEKTLYFDCGVDDPDNTIKERIDDFFLGYDDADPGNTVRNTTDTVFIFDEFQYARTINEDQEEIDKTSQRCIWNLIDSGVLDFVTMSWNIRKIKSYIETLDRLYVSGKIPKELVIQNEKFPADLNETLAVYLYALRVPEDNRVEEDYGNSQLETAKKDCNILPWSKKTGMFEGLSKLDLDLAGDIFKELRDAPTFKEYLEICKRASKLISSPKKIDCSKSLIFIIGNLDEAFGISGDLDPDVSADIMWKISSNVSILDIKDALKSRFKPEQIGRLGNNIIIYPSLKKSDLEIIIEKELRRIKGDFKTNYSRDIEFTSNFKELVYREGVYPSQGVRPIFSTLGSLCLPKLSKIIELDIPAAVIDCDTNFDRSEVKSRILDTAGKVLFEFTDSLSLGKLRDVDGCNKIPLHAVHEAGHAVLMTLLDLEIPDMILALSSSGGGYTYREMEEHNKKKFSAETIQEINNSVQISLAGYWAEVLVFGDEKKSIGCSGDLQEAWETLSNAFYRGGYVYPVYSVQNGGMDACVPRGDSDILSIYRSDANDFTIYGQLRHKYQGLSDSAKKLVEDNLLLVVEIGKYLTKNRYMTPSVYKQYIKEYGSEKIQRTLEYINERKKGRQSYYVDKILNW